MLQLPLAHLRVPVSHPDDLWEPPGGDVKGEVGAAEAATGTGAGADASGRKDGVESGARAARKAGKGDTTYPG